MTAFTLICTYDDFYAVMHGGRRVAIVTPARPALDWPRSPALPWSVILDPEAFPEVPATNLPWPLRNTAMSFNSLDDVLSFLGLSNEEMAA